MSSVQRPPNEEFLNQLWPGLAPWSERKTLLLIVVASALMGFAALAYGVANYQRGGSPETFWKSAIRWLFVVAPAAVITGALLCAVPAVRRHGLRLLVLGSGLAVGFVGPVLAVLGLLRLEEWWRNP
jgi:hypothetical protein